VAFLCALLLSAAVHWLRPIQTAVASLGLTRAVLEAAGRVETREALSDREVVARFLEFERRVIDLEAEGFTDAVDSADFDYRFHLTEDQDPRPRYMQAYLLYEDGRLAMMVLPFYGPGMWSTIHGLVALEADLATVAGMTIHEHGETPGIGDRIQAPEWLETWRGRRIYDSNGRYRFRITMRPEPELAPFSVDAITGATVTVQAVDQAMAEWFGSAGYGPVLARLREEQP
jgi:Na+-transporting NADH:ubiquinone oxidoreductase subunit C